VGLFVEDQPHDQRRRQINITRTLPKPNPYALALDREYASIAFNEERAPLLRGKWRSEVFKCDAEYPMDLEIGTGAGFFFAHRAVANPNRKLLGIEVKYKPLIQSIRRAQKMGAENAAVIRYHAFNLADLFDEGELNHVFIHFPDPWVTPNKPKNRIVNRVHLNLLYKMQRPGSFLEFKTDSREYFLWALEEIKNSPYTVEYQTLNLHQSEKASTNFMTAFEKIFTRQGIEINYILLRKN
jgi:tRNA (guanine-N7-)-methyltransferase